jgi:cytidylate kinase
MKGGIFMKNYIVTISREFGSGGRDVGKMLADELGLPCFDKEIMHIAAEKSGMAVDFIEKSSESVSSKFLLNLNRLSLRMPAYRLPTRYSSFNIATAHPSHNGQPDIDKLFLIQSAVIKEIADSGGGVIIGRCAGYVLKDFPRLLSVFVRGNFEDRVSRAVEVYKRPEKKAAVDVKKIDKHRANYYKTFTGRQWGNTCNYDLVVNTSYTGIPGAAKIIKTMLETKIS